MTQALLGLGSNLGPRDELLAAALRALAALPHTRVLAHSRWYETQPVGGPPGQGAFLNGAALLETQLNPAELHQSLRHIETEAGRERLVRWQARTLDLDVLLFGDALLNSRHLTIPHPRMAVRRFVLEPAAEIAPHLVHPPSEKNVAQLLARLDAASGWVVILESADDAADQWLHELGQGMPVHCWVPSEQVSWSDIAQDWRSRGAIVVSTHWPHPQPNVPNPMLIVQSPFAGPESMSGPLSPPHHGWSRTADAPQLVFSATTLVEVVDELSATLAGMR